MKHRELERLDIDDVTKIHERYLGEFASLSKTAEWVRERYDIESVNRHHLSYFFHSRGLEVYPPNGRPQEYWQDKKNHVDEMGKFASDLVESTWSDILSYLKGGGSKIDFMSACAFVGSEFYERCIGTLMRGVKNLTVDPSLLPKGITAEEIIKGKTLYEDGYEYWVRMQHE